MSGWNRSTANTEKVEHPLRNGKKTVWMIVCGFLVLLGVCAYFLIPQSTPDTAKPSAKSSRIREVVPASAKPVQVEVVTNEPIKTVRVGNDIVPVKGLYTNSQGKVYWNGKKLSIPKNKHKGKYAIFDFHSENVIAGLISVEPGTMFYGRPTYGEHFKQDFLKSCERPIIVSEKDDDYVKGLKKSMNEVKIELRNRMASGEDLCKIVNDARDDMQKLGFIKRDVSKLVNQLVKEGAKSEADVDDIIGAANKMLEAKGVAPLNVNPIIRSALIRSAERNAEKTE